jgi:invasion protein IalB
LTAPGGQLWAALAIAAWMVSTAAVAQQPVVPQAPPEAAATAASPQAQPQPAQPIPLIYTPWTKYCLRVSDARQTCFIGKDGRVDSGEVLIAAVIVEPGGDAKKILRVTLPLGMQLGHGTRVSIDGKPPRQAPYVVCLNNGCIADYEANPELIADLKQGQTLIVQAINDTGSPVGLPLPLQDAGAGFAKAYDGEPVDPMVTDENYRKLNEALQQQPEAAPVPAAVTAPGAATKQE